MPSLFVSTRAGGRHHLRVEDGRSVMQAIRQAGIDELLAMCGGCCSCATCHVYVDDDFLDRLPPVDEGEEALLDSSRYRTANSRLSCQIPLTASLDGLRVTIAPED